MDIVISYLRERASKARQIAKESASSSEQSFWAAIADDRDAMAIGVEALGKNDATDAEATALIARWLARELGKARPSQWAQTLSIEALAWLDNHGFAGYLPMDKAPEDDNVILATTGGHVGEAIMLVDQDTGAQCWTWANGKPLHANHKPLGWLPMPQPIEGAP